MEAPVALYIHWPFCVSKCPYCDFNSHVRDEIDQEAWQAALLKDLSFEAQQLQGGQLGSIFFGGGTPSLMAPSLVEALIYEARKHWSFVEDIEISLEANPSSVEALRFADLALAGVNRISLGVQSFDDKTLAFLGRAHGALEAKRAINVAQNAFRRVSFDLIYALPSQTPENLGKELESALGFGTRHLSLYQLTIEPGTRFSSLVAAGAIEPLDPDQAANLYEIASEMAKNAGLLPYEISNYCVPGEESRHNLSYWRYGDYAGVGPGAHGRRNGLATVKHKKPENWMSAVDRNGHGTQSEEKLSPEQMAREALVMGLRLAEGIDLSYLCDRFHFKVDELVDVARINALSRHALIKLEETQLTILPAGRLLLDRILSETVVI